MITIEDFMELNCDPVFENIKLWDLNAEDYIFEGSYADLDDNYRYLEICSWNTETDAICFNVELN